MANGFDDNDDIKFLNRQAFIESISLLIDSAIKEIIMVVPYIKVSESMWQNLKKADKLGKEIVIVYREDSMINAESKKLISLKNITLLTHPHVHAKCYFNELTAIVGSMNLYEYSEKHNREMGLLIHRSGYMMDTFKELLNEVITIINASTIEKQSDFVRENGFKMEILKSKEEKLREAIPEINKIFVNKKFIVEMDNEFTNSHVIKCFPYIEDIIAYLDYKVFVGENDILIRRIRLKFKLDESICRKIRAAFWKNFTNLDLNQFQIYWDEDRDLTIYANRLDFPQWNDLNFNQNLRKLKQGLDKIIAFIKYNLKNYK